MSDQCSGVKLDPTHQQPAVPNETGYKLCQVCCDAFGIKITK